MNMEIVKGLSIGHFVSVGMLPIISAKNDGARLGTIFQTNRKKVWYYRIHTHENIELLCTVDRSARKIIPKSIGTFRIWLHLLGRFCCNNFGTTDQIVNLSSIHFAHHFYYNVYRTNFL